MADPSGDYGAGLANTAQSQGQSAINNFDPTSVANTQKGSFNNLFSTQQQSGQNYVNQYASQIAKNPNVTDLYTQANDRYGVQPLAQKAAYLNSQVAGMPEQQQNLMRGFDANQGQVDNATNYQLMRLQPLAGQATAEAQAAQNLAGQEVGYGIQQNQQNLLPIQAMAPILQQNMAAQATGWTQAAQQEFAGLQQKMQSGVALSQQEMDRANILAQAEASYQNEITKANAATASAKIQYQNQLIGPGATYYNTATGQPYNPFTKVIGQK